MKTRRHTETEEITSPLGPGWPLATSGYVRTSKDLSEPPLVLGRPLLTQAECPLCEIASGLEGRGFSPEASAWAERDFILSLVEGDPEDEIFAALAELYGLEVRAEELHRHRRAHVPGLRATQTEAISGLSSEDFDSRSWREIFDGLHLSVACMRRALANGEMRPTMAESLQAAKLLSELTSYSLDDPETNEKQTPLLLIQGFMVEIKDAIGDVIPDPEAREAASEKLAEIARDIQNRLAGSETVTPPLPRGREEKGGGRDE